MIECEVATKVSHIAFVMAALVMVFTSFSMLMIRWFCRQYLHMVTIQFQEKYKALLRGEDPDDDSEVEKPVGF